nr:transposase, MuDR, MULE transposase domain protein [Tanacetum cinerariifolium]
MHGFSENPMYVPGFPGYPMQDPHSDSANRKLKHVVGSPKNKKPNERDLLYDEKLLPFGEKIMGSVFGKVKRLSDEDESSESDEDAETTPVANKNFKEDKFWNMPPLLKTPVLDIKKKGICYGTSSLVRLHDTFDSKEQIKIVLDRKALEEGFQIRYPRSDPQRVYAKCIVDTWTHEESFSELPLYCHNLKLKNQWTITHIETDDEDRFEIFFLAVGAVRNIGSGACYFMDQ